MAGILLPSRALMESLRSKGRQAKAAKMLEKSSVQGAAPLPVMTDYDLLLSAEEVMP